MTSTRPGPAGGFARRSGLVCALVLAGVGGGAGGGAVAQAKAPPAIVLTPNSGTPGSVVAIRGTGFCDTPSCSTVTVLFAGVPAAEGIEVARDGTFRGRFKVPGGGVVGATNVTATQTRPDGYEITAYATYDLVFGLGEEAELQAEINDLAAQPPGSANPEKPLRGLPLESAAAIARGETPAPSEAPAEPVSRIAAARRAVADRWWLALVALPVVALGAVALRRRRRSA